MIKLTKRHLRNSLGVGSDAALARWFGISPAAVSQWPDDAGIPERRAMEAALRRPDLFGAISQPAANDGEAPPANAGEC